MDPIIELIKKSGCGAVLLPGDCFHGDEMYMTGAEFLREASKVCPVFFSIGNHEMKCGFDVTAEAERCGASVLDNSSAEFNGVIIGGLTTGYPKLEKQTHFKKSPPPDLEWLERFSALPGYKLLLCHHPEYYARYIRRLPVDLTVSGHAHGGQWRFFGRGVFAPGQGIFPKYTSGMYEGRLIVSRGVGNPHFIPRINNKPEVIVIKIK
ncbi:MAG: metallophosphoesterase [Clostridia bacterium]|nr:metallophosphoesterase [Clostridia bacterium]